MPRHYNIISSDGHLEVPPERWNHRVPQQYRARAPHTITLEDGGDALAIEGLPPQAANFIDLRAGRNANWKPFGVKVEEVAGTGPAEQRLKEQDIDHVDAEVLFPAMLAGPVIWRSMKDDGLYKAVIRAYNDWLAQEYCAVAPDRLLGMGVIPISNTADAIAEMEHCAKLGLKGVMLPSLPSGLDYPSNEDDRFWAAALDLDMPLTVHVKFSPRDGFLGAPGKSFLYPKETPELMKKLRRGLLDWVTAWSLVPATSIAQLILQGVFDRFPKLNIFFAETRVGWLPFWMENADCWYQRHVGWSQELLGYEPIKRLPSEYMRSNFFWSIQYERAAVELRHHLGTDRIMFATDFPHIECEWPDSKPIMDKLYSDVPEQEKRMIWAENAIRFFKLPAA